MSLQEVEVRYTVELTHTLTIPEGKTASDVVRDYFESIRNGGPALGKTHPDSAQLRFMFDADGERVFLP